MQEEKVARVVCLVGIHHASFIKKVSTTLIIRPASTDWRRKNTCISAMEPHPRRKVYNSCVEHNDKRLFRMSIDSKSMCLQQPNKAFRLFDMPTTRQ